MTIERYVIVSFLLLLCELLSIFATSVRFFSTCLLLVSLYKCFCVWKCHILGTHYCTIMRIIRNEGILQVVKQAVLQAFLICPILIRYKTKSEEKESDCFLEIQYVYLFELYLKMIKGLKTFLSQKFTFFSHTITNRFMGMLLKDNVMLAVRF
jgi:hypothetical protein